MEIIEIYTDGACSGNPGKGGWSCVVYDKINNVLVRADTGGDKYLGLFEDTTNNRMEIHGLLRGLELATKVYSESLCIIYCDSAYCVNMFNDWINKWAANGWMNSKNEVVKNFELVKELYKYKKVNFPNFKVTKCKGHVNDIGNELADAYAVSEYTGDKTKINSILEKNHVKNEILSI